LRRTVKWMAYEIVYATKVEDVTLGDDLCEIRDGIYDATYAVQFFVHVRNVKPESRKLKRR
jgi:hypothetical protein